MNLDIKQASLLFFVISIIVSTSLFIFLDSSIAENSKQIKSLSKSLSAESRNNAELTNNINEMSTSINQMQSHLKNTHEKNSNSHQEDELNFLDDEIRHIKRDVNRNREAFEKNVAQIKKTRDEISIVDKKTLEIDRKAGDFSDIIKSALNSVTIIETDESLGAGFVISVDGHIVTNFHVIEDSSTAKPSENISVKFRDDAIYKPKVIGFDSDLDIAVLKIDGKFQKLAFANSDNVDIGDEVITLGNPFGFNFSASQGIVSAVKRQDDTVSKQGIYIQTDTAVNPGNSGGPLLNRDGNVIGMITWGIAFFDSGLNFAIESNKIRVFLDKTIK